MPENAYDPTYGGSPSGAGYDLGAPLDPETQLGGANAYDVYQSSLPELNRAREYNVNAALGQAGMGGSRFGTNTERNVAQVGADAASHQNKMLMDLLYNQQQGDLNRGLQASQIGLQEAGLEDQMMQNRINQMFGMGQWETGRQDQFAQMAYNDFEQNKLGWLPLLMQWAGGSGMPAQGGPSGSMTEGGPGAMDYAMQAAMMGSMMKSDERLKTEIERFPIDASPGIPMATWTWKATGMPGSGVIAQDVEKIRPAAVSEIGGYKVVNYAML